MVFNILDKLIEKADRRRKIKTVHPDLKMKEEQYTKFLQEYPMGHISNFVADKKDAIKQARRYVKKGMKSMKRTYGIVSE